MPISQMNIACNRTREHGAYTMGRYGINIIGGDYK
jgi:hypothetical protein